MQFINYWQQFEHTGRVEDYLKYLQRTGREELSSAACDSGPGDCRAEENADLAAGEDGSCRNPCM